jgi:arsenate reductase
LDYPEQDAAMPISIYHNPRCSKSRQTLQILHDRGHEPDIIEYLKSPPDAGTLGELVTLLGVQPIDIMRTNEPEYRAAADKLQSMNADQQISWLAANPKVLQRPIIVSGNQARIGRPPETVLEILD